VSGRSRRPEPRSVTALRLPGAAARVKWGVAPGPPSGRASRVCLDSGAAAEVNWGVARGRRAEGFTLARIQFANPCHVRYNAHALKRAVTALAAQASVSRRPGDEWRSCVGTKQDTALGIRLGFGLLTPVPLLDAEPLSFDRLDLERHTTSRPATDEPASGSHGWRESRISDSLVLASKEESTQTCSTMPTPQRRD